MKKIFTCLILFGSFWASSEGFAQQTVTGKVTAENGESLPGVSVLVKGTTIGTVTDIDGNYILNVTPSSDVLIFSFIGYKTTEVAISGRSRIDFQMELDVTQLSEVVVTSFGIEQEKRSLGYAVQEVSSDEISQANQPNVVNALQGKIAGVTINNSGGAPGAGASILIRGVTSLTPGANNQPLFVIDGIPISNETIAGSQLPSAGSNSPASSEQFSFSNRATDIDPENIQSISILKGPSATALYGLRAANGVVVITTKKGQAGKARINFTTSVGWDELAKSPEYQTSYREGRFGRLRFRSNGNPLRFQSFGPAVTPTTPVFDVVDDFFETGQRFENSISISGGNENTTYFTSVSRLDQSGIVPNSDWDRTAITFSGTKDFSDILKFSTSVTYSNSGGNRPHAGDKSIMSALSYHPTTFDVNDYINPDGSMRDYSDGIIDNPRYLAEFSTMEDNVNRLIGNVGFNLTPLKWLNIDYKIGTDYYNDARLRVVPPGLDVSSQTGGFLIDEQINYREINSNFLVTLSKDFNEDISASLLLGHQVTDIKSNRTNTRGEQFTLANFYDLSNTTNVFASNDQFQRRLVGVFADAKLNYKGTVYLSITGRNDWSSTLPKENRSFFYPSVSLGYVFTETLAATGIKPDFLTYGKLRTSWAKVGKDAGPYQIGVTYGGATNFPFGDINGFRQSTLAGSDELRPETTTSIEIGTDLRFLDNRIGIDLTYFKQRSEDQIIPVPVSNTTGFSRFVTNAGEIENTGWELLLTGTPIKTPDFSWDVSVNWSKLESDVVSIAEGVDEIEFFNAGFVGIVNKLVPGGSVGDLYGYNFVKSDDGRLVIDDNGFPFIRTDTLLKVGNALPDWQGGITNTFNYKGLSLSFLLEWRQGGDVYDMGIRNGIRNGILAQTERRYEQVIFKGVQNTGTDEDPVFVENTTPVQIDGESLYRNSIRYNRAADIVLEDASWFRLRTVSLGYSLPKSILPGNAIERATITLTGNNLFINTPFRGYDPEASYLGSGSNAFGFTGLVIPNTRSYSVKLNLTF
ncbi:MAG: SusC/RagA family TonB-linked outer membrane protein [Bacteroidota bacterium]